MLAVSGETHKRHLCGTRQASVERKFFFEKKNQKTFARFIAALAGRSRDSMKKFFASFFKKEALHLQCPAFKDSNAIRNSRKA